MRKISLNVDDLAVESYRTTPRLPRQRGTVLGHTGDASHPTWYDACHVTVTFGEATCDCLVPRTDARYCNTARACMGGIG